MKMFVFTSQQTAECYLYLKRDHAPAVDEILKSAIETEKAEDGYDPALGISDDVFANAGRQVHDLLIGDACPLLVMEDEHWSIQGFYESMLDAGIDQIDFRCLMEAWHLGVDMQAELQSHSDFAK